MPTAVKPGCPAGPRAVCGGAGERAAVVHGRADHEACRHLVIEQVKRAFRRMGLIFPLETEGDNSDWATIWLTGVGTPASGAKGGDTFGAESGKRDGVPAGERTAPR
jgi:hypothetical protein